MKGGLIFEVVAGKRVGKYAQAPHREQTHYFIASRKILVYYFWDAYCTVPVIEAGIPHKALTSPDKLKQIGFYN